MVLYNSTGSLVYLDPVANAPVGRRVGESYNPDTSRVLDMEEIRQTLERALARACPRALRAETDDLVQAALTRILETQAKKGPDAVRAASYVWRTAFSVIADELRRRRRKPVAPLDPERMDPHDSGPSPEASAVSTEAGRALRDCLANLARPRQLAIMLHLQGQRLAEAAALLGWTVKRFENLLYRGLTELRGCLASKGVGGG